VVVFEEVAVLKHLILVTNVVLGFAGQSLLHHARLKCILGGYSCLSLVCYCTCILAECIARISN
jgi:hypothetical protein